MSEGLSFQGPFGIGGATHPLVFDQAIAKRAGIYLWVMPYSCGGYLVSYVGETGSSMASRIEQHAVNLLGGYYRICDAELLMQGQVKVLWNGMWRPGTRDRLPEYVRVAEQLVPSARLELQHAAAFVAPLEADMRLRRRVEGALAMHIKGQGPPASQLLPTDVRYHVRRPGESEVRVAVLCASMVHGLPSSVNA